MIENDRFVYVVQRNVSKMLYNRLLNFIIISSEKSKFYCIYNCIPALLELFQVQIFTSVLTIPEQFLDYGDTSPPIRFTLRPLS